MEIYVRRINLELMERMFAPMGHETIPSRRGFINEIAFEMFAADLSGQYSSRPDMESNCISVARTLIQQLDNIESTHIPDPTPLEMDDARTQVYRLNSFVQLVAQGRHIETKPAFSGCGIISSCQGDIYVGDELFEIKAGDRNLRSLDLRQLMVYSALNHAEKKRTIKRVGVFNPRVGMHFSTTIDELCAEVSGKSATEALAEMVHIFSGADISR